MVVCIPPCRRRTTILAAGSLVLADLAAGVAGLEHAEQLRTALVVESFISAGEEPPGLRIRLGVGTARFQGPSPRRDPCTPLRSDEPV